MKKKPAVTFAKNPAPERRYRDLLIKEIAVAGNVRREVGNVDELAQSIRVYGVLEPVLVREFLDRTGFELVAGERRFTAAKLAGLEVIPAISVGAIDDQQVIELQLTENVQREGLSELDEAFGLRVLHVDFKVGVDDLAARIGKSKGHVYARLKLAEAPAGVHAALQKGTIPASVALLIARIPNEAKALAALKEIANGGPWVYDEGGANGRHMCMSAREAQKHIEKHHQRPLKGAPFNVKIEDLVEDRGACAECPFNTANAVGLFDSKKGQAMCTDVACYDAKTTAQNKRERERHKAKGEKLVKPSKYLDRWSSSTEPKRGSGVVLLTGQVPGSKKTWEDVLEAARKKEEDVPSVLVTRHPTTNKVVKMVDAAAAAKLAGVKLPKEAPPDDWKARQESEKRARAIGAKAWEAMLADFVVKDVEEMEPIAVCRWIAMRRANKTLKQALGTAAQDLARLLVLESFQPVHYNGRAHEDIGKLGEFIGNGKDYTGIFKAKVKELSKAASKVKVKGIVPAGDADEGELDDEGGEE